MKKCYTYIFLFVFCFVITFLYNFFLLNVNCDEIWNYGFSYNITRGMIIYRDFNVLQTPLFFFIGSLFVRIFGNHIYSYDIYISVIVSVVILLSYRIIGKNSVILFFIIGTSLLPSYNSLCVLFGFILLIINDSNIKNKVFWMGLVTGIIFLTKQSIGLVMFVVLLLFMKNKKKYFFGFLIPNLLLFIYLIFYDCVDEYINYCFLGMFDFGNSNLAIVVPYFVIFCFVCIFLGYCIIKSRFTNINLIIILAFQIVAYPIFDRNHVMMGVVLCFIYLFIKYQIFVSKYYRFILIISFSYFVSLCTLPKDNYHLYSSGMYSSGNNSILEYKGIYSDNLVGYDNYVDAVEKVIIKYDSGYDNVHVYSIYSAELSYICKLNLNYRIDKYDLILNGNIGYNGGSRYIEELDILCKKESCLFLIDNSNGFDLSQTNKDIYYFVIDNYTKIDDIKDLEFDFSVYSNDKELNNE